MKDLIQIVPDKNSTDSLIVNENLLQREITYIRFGQFCSEVEVRTSAEIKNDEVLLSANIIEKLNLPLQPKYELRITPYEVIIGPYIGILAYRKTENLHESVSILSNYLYDYGEIGGAVLAFAADGVDIEKGLIEGYIYDPTLKQWEHGFYSYPVALFKRAGMSRVLRDRFHSILGDRIFNSYIFNKWEMHQWLSQFPTSTPNLPETILYEQPDDLIWFLKTFNAAFIKPIYGSQGLGIFIAEKKGPNFIFQYKENGKMRKEVFISQIDAKAFIKETFKSKRFIIQESIKILKHDEKVIDFRMLLVKDELGNWRDYNLITRFGAKGNYVSNISDGGKAELAEDTFKRILQLSGENLFQFRNKITDIGITAAKNLESVGLHLGNLGIDIALDEDLNIWIIEINNKDPNHTISIDAHDRQTFYEVKRANMLYAKYLTGF